MKLVEILYQDSWYYVFNKPAGLLVVPAPDEQKTLTDLVNQQYPPQAGEGLLYPCHRLDRDTSGVIIFARGKKNQQLLMDEFRKRSIKKEYIAFVQGKMRQPHGVINRPISSFEEKRFDRRAQPKPAITEYHVLKQKTGYSIVQVFIKTGRTNQIRIHLGMVGNPLVGERKYAFAKDFELKFRRTALHAAAVTWYHPITKKEIHVQTPLPEDMMLFIANH